MSTASQTLSEYMSIALVQLNHIAIRVTDKDSLPAWPQPNGLAAERDTSGLKPPRRSRDVRAEKREVCDSRMLFRQVH